MGTKGAQSNQILINKHNGYNTNYKLIVIQHVQKHEIAKMQKNLVLMNPVFDDVENRRNDL